MALAALFLALSLGFVDTRAQSPPPSDKAEALAAAARKGDYAAVTKLLDEGVDVNSKFRYGATALSYAADHGNIELAL